MSAMRFRLFPLLLALALAVPAGALRAQVIRGTVVDQGERALSGVVLQLLDVSSRVVSRSLSNEQGEYRLAAPAAGSYRIRTMRIGYRAATTETFTVAPRTELLKNISLASVGVSLDTMRVVARNSCRLATDSSAATFAVWEQVRTALTAAEITGKERIAGSTF